nr:Hpt domain-containing protein [Nitrospirota bacterium]
MSVDLSKFQGAFFEESAEHVATMEEGLLQLEQQPGDLDLLNRIFRAAHSIKGNAGMFGFTAVGAFTHKMENILDALRNGQMDVTKPLIDLLLEATDGLKGLLEAARTDAAPDEATVGPLRERLQAYGDGREASCAKREASETEGRDTNDEIRDTRYASRDTPRESRFTKYAIHWAPAPTVFARGLHPSQIVRELRSLGDLTSEKDVDHLPPLEELAAEGRALSLSFTLETEHSREEVEDVFLFVCDDSELTINEEGGAMNDERESRNTDSPVQPSAFSAHRSEGEAPKPLGQ